MTEPIKLPPLPSPEFPGVIVKGTKAIPRYLFTANQLTDYARAAIEADRKRRGESVAVPTKTQIDDAMCKVSMPFFPDETRDGTDWIIQQFVKELWKIATPQPAEPVKEVTIPEGWKLVPIEPTPEMRDAITSGIRHDHMVKVYQAMLEAAPKT